LSGAAGFRHKSLYRAARYGQEALSPLYDYYFTIYFTLDTNNEQIKGVGQTGWPGALSGWYLYGDQTRIGVKGALPTNENSDQAPFFLAYITNQ